ncbi:MAG: PEGA domain-containing protein [Candidatus Poribacteria bacterium]|nr:PEGA domain-containing protein [Candidatus Poribacteria bacterium]
MSGIRFTDCPHPSLPPAGEGIRARSARRWMGVMALVMLLGASVEVSAQSKIWALFLDFGTPEGARELPPMDKAFRGLHDHLYNEIGVPAEQMRVVPSERLTRDGIRTRIDVFSRTVPRGGIVLIYMRAYVTKPRTGNSKYFYAADANINAAIDANPAPIRDTELNEWLNVFNGSTVILLLDLRSNDPSLNVYFAAQRKLGDAAIALVARNDLKKPTSEYVAMALSEDADGDHDSVLTLDELAAAFKDAIYKDGASSDNVLVGATGAPDLRLYSLPSAIVVESNPLDAFVYVDGERVGRTPFRMSNLIRKQYSVTVALDGYRKPSPERFTVRELDGKAYPHLFVLEPLSIRGKVDAPTGAEIGAVYVGVTPETELRAELEGLGDFSISTKNAGLVAEKEYHVVAGTADDKYYAEASFVFKGSDDIVRDLMLKERTLWEIASARFAGGYIDEAIAAAREARSASRDVPQLDDQFMYALVNVWAHETLDARAMTACALFATYLGDTKTALEYWKLARNAAEKGSEDYEYAASMYKAAGGGRFPTLWIALIVLALVVGLGATFALRNRKA